MTRTVVIAGQGALALAVLYAVVAYQLGHWQYGRHEFKVERNALLDAEEGSS